MFKRINRKAPEIMEALKNAPIFRKQAIVEARPAEPGELVITRIAGKEETRKVAGPDDMRVKNPGGEEYLISRELFSERYRVTDVTGEHADRGFKVYEATGLIRAIENPFGVPIEIVPEWDKDGTQSAGADCRIVDTCDAEGKLRGEPYLIDGKAFLQTYMTSAWPSVAR